MEAMWAQSPRVQRWATVALIVGVALQYVSFCAMDDNPLRHPEVLALRLIGYGLGSVLAVGACYVWAKRGDYHGAWAWFGLLSLLGVIVLGVTFKHSMATRELRGFTVLPPEPVAPPLPRATPVMPVLPLSADPLNADGDRDREDSDARDGGGQCA